MAHLPNKSFVFNYNARDYDPATFTIPNEVGATMNKDMVWTATTSTIRSNIQLVDDHLVIPLGAFSLFDFGTTGTNPINNTSAAPAMTIVGKLRLTSGGSNFICNRGPEEGTTAGDYYNFMARVGSTSSGKLTLHTSTSNSGSGEGVSYPEQTIVTALWRVNSNRQIDIKNLTAGTSNTPFTGTWRNGSRWFSFYAWVSANNTVSETMGGEFYWCYLSKEYLTDEEIDMVVAYNEQKGVSITPDSGDFAASGGTATITVESETPWSAATTDAWISFAPTSGDSGTTSVAVSVAKTNFNSRTGKITFTDTEENEVEYIAGQTGNENKVPYKKAYRGTRRIN